MSTTVRVAIIGAVATIVAALITVVAPTMLKRDTGSDSQAAAPPSEHSTAPAASTTPDEINLTAESVAKAIGVLGPPINPMSEYQALTSSWRRTGDGRVEPAPLSTDEPRRIAQWAFQARHGVYSFLATYANGSQPGEDRTLDVAVNGDVMLAGKFGTQTGGWLPQNRVIDETLGEVRLKDGTNILEISCPSSRNFPHVSSLKLRYLRN